MTECNDVPRVCQDLVLVCGLDREGWDAHLRVDSGEGVVKVVEWQVDENLLV